MILHITDDNYRNKVERFIHQNFENYSNVKVRSNWQDHWLTSTKVLTDDKNMFAVDNRNVFLLTPNPPNQERQIYKYQKFDQILDRMGYEHLLVDNKPIRVIYITSLLGGVGKTTIAKALAKLYPHKGNIHYIPLLSPKDDNYNLNDALFNLSFGESITEIPTSGFTHLDDLLSGGLAENIAQLKSALSKKGIRVLIIDAPPHIALKELSSEVDLLLLIRDQRRIKEESNWLKTLDITAFKQLYNFVGYAQQHNEIPLIDIDTQPKELEQCLHNYLKMEGIIE